jgi:hypothetical protein
MINAAHITVTDASLYQWSCRGRDHMVIGLIDLFIFGVNATFSNISAISWRPVLVVEEAGVPGENHRPWASNW